MGAPTLAQVLHRLPQKYDPRLLAGWEAADDAAVYSLNKEQALVYTLDFFTPIVDDPYSFGQIAAANALSDIYAMGGEPFLALNIVCYPTCLSLEILTQILKGGADKTHEAGALVGGGHTVEDNELKYGLAAAGFLHPEKMLRNGGARPGDYLVLTKPLGTGIISTAIKGEVASLEIREEAAASMAALNRDASRAALSCGLKGCTDITGFGLLGHALEMAEASGVKLVFCSEDIPFLPGAGELASQGLIPAGAYSNKAYVEEKLEIDSGVSREKLLLLCDPQTSGGLLLPVPEKKLAKLKEELTCLGSTGAWVVGRVEAAEGERKPLRVE